MKLLFSPFKLTAWSARRMGIRRLVWLSIGAVIGALITPIAGPELRRRITAEIIKRRAGAEPTVEERVRRRLAESPRTWHLPQPEVVAVRGDSDTDWRIILAGTAADDASRSDLEAAVRGVTGVSEVDNRIRVQDTGD